MQGKEWLPLGLLPLALVVMVEGKGIMGMKGREAGIDTMTDTDFTSEQSSSHDSNGSTTPMRNYRSQRNVPEI